MQEQKTNKRLCDFWEYPAAQFNIPPSYDLMAVFNYYGARLTVRQLMAFSETWAGMSREKQTESIEPQIGQCNVGSDDIDAAIDEAIIGVTTMLNKMPMIAHMLIGKICADKDVLEMASTAVQYWDKTLFDLSQEANKSHVSNADLMAAIMSLQSDAKAIEVNTTATAINSAETRKNAAWLRQDRERRIREAEKRGRDNQRKGEKNGNGRKTDPRLKNQIKTEVRQTKENNPAFSTSDACAVVARKHLKADGKTPIFSKRTIENWMSEAKKRKAKKP